MKQGFVGKILIPGFVLLPELIAGVALVVAIAVTGTNAFTRYLVGFTYAGTDEIVCMAFAWTVFPGAAAAFRRGMHYGIDLFVGLLPSRARGIADLFTRLAVTAIVAYVAWLSWILTRSAGSKVMTATRIPYTYFDAAMLLGFLLMAVYSAWFLIRDARALVGGKKTKEHAG